MSNSLIGKCPDSSLFNDRAEIEGLNHFTDMELE